MTRGKYATDEEALVALGATDRSTYATLVLADVLDTRLGEFTFHVGDGTEPGALEALVMAIRDKS